MWQHPFLRTHPNKGNLDDQAVLQKVPKPWNMEQKVRRHPVIPGVLQKLQKPRNRPVFTGFPNSWNVVGRHSLKVEANSGSVSFLQLRNYLQKLQKPRNKAVNTVIGIFASFVLIGLTVFSGVSQEKPKARLAVEFSKASCDDLIAYVDLLALPLSENSGAQGLAIFYPERGNPGPAIRFEEFLLWSQGFIKRFGSNPPRVIHGTPRAATKVEFWIVPLGADEPKFTAADSGETFANVSKPFLYNTEFGGEMCPAANPKLMADLLAFNPNVNLRVVVRGKTARYRHTKMNEWLRKLVTREKIPRDRIRVLLSEKLADYYPYQDVEFWFVPAARYSTSVSANR